MSSSSAPRGGVIAGAAVPHAPQFFTLPETEDHDQVDRVRRGMADIGSRLLDLEPDVIIIIANDHLENFYLHSVPAFTIHCGSEAVGSFAGQDFFWPVPGGVGTSLVREIADLGFDPAFTHTAPIGYEFGIPLTFLGIGATVPVLPIWVNSYVAPQPSPDRCYGFGRALHRAAQALGIRAVLVSSGGLSHFPGTDQYSNPEVDFDRALIDRLRSGNLRSLLALTAEELDRTGNVEARSWHILAGALGERAPDVVEFEPSWHHVYATVGWTSSTVPISAPLHYPLMAPDRIALSRALHRLRSDASARQTFLETPFEFATDLLLRDDERTALMELDEEALRALGVHPLLGFLARLSVDLQRGTR